MGNFVCLFRVPTRRCFLIFVIRLLQWNIRPESIVWKMSPLCIWICCCNIFKCEVTHFSLWETVLGRFIHVTVHRGYLLPRVLFFTSNSLFLPPPQGSKPESTPWRLEANGGHQCALLQIHRGQFKTPHNHSWRSSVPCIASLQNGKKESITSSLLPKPFLWSCYENSNPSPCLKN